CWLTAACTKEDTPPQDTGIDDTENPVEEEDFDVKLEGGTVFKVGEAVEFKLEGDPESINFFSGLPGYEYEYREGKPMPSGMELEFSIRFNLSASSWPVDRPEWGPLPWDKIALLVSTDFDGDYSFLNVKQTEWHDVTNRMTFPEI